MKETDILFVCTGNTCRSPMAQGIFEAIDGKAAVKSRGILVYESTPASRFAVLAMEEIGVDISGHMSAALNPADVDQAALILTMTVNHKNIIIKSHPQAAKKTFTLWGFAKGENKDVADPFGQSLDQYKKCRDELKLLIEKIVKTRGF